MGTTPTDHPGCAHAAATRGELVDDAERTLRAIGAIAREDAADFLRMTVHHAELDAEERRVLLDRFESIDCGELLGEAEQVIASASSAVRCPAAHREDPSPCEGPADSVRIVDAAGEETFACIRHGAVLLASLVAGRVYPGQCTIAGAAIEVFRRAKRLKPYEFLRGNHQT